MGNYDDCRKKPFEHLAKAEQILLQLDPERFTSDADSIAYAQALIDLAQTQMTGSLRR